VNAIKKLKLDIDYEETKGVEHTPSEEIAETAYRKMRARTRELYPQQIWLQSNRPDTLFNRADWVQVYQSLNPGKEQRLLLRRGSGQIRLNQNSFRVDASIASPNHIEIKTDNVQTMRLYFNDRLVDLKKPVTVTVNKKPRFEGLVKPSVEEMLNDQLFLGRGWRYYTAVLDLDLAPSSSTTRPTTAPALRPPTSAGAPK